MYLFPFYDITILAQSLLFLPQIRMFSQKKARAAPNTLHLVSVFLRCILPFYLRGCPQNIFQLSPSFSFCSLWLSSFLFQLLIIYLQARLGGRFFIPRCLLFLCHNDGYRLMEEPEAENECCICLEGLHGCNNEGVVRAPCHHVFHLECLRMWIEVKRQCPTCRSRLPELEI